MSKKELDRVQIMDRIAELRIPTKSCTHSGPSRAPIPIEADHPFHLKAIT